MSRLFLNRILIGVMGLIAGGLVLYVSRIITIRKPPAKRVSDMIEDSNVSGVDKNSDKLIKGLGLSFDSWRVALRWAKLGGKFKSWSVGGMVFRGALFAGLAFILIILFAAPIYTWLLVPILLFVPYLMVNGRATDTKRIVTRLLPETVTVIAAEMDAGSTATQAISRASELPSALGQILNRAVYIATQSGRALFSHGAVRGVLVEEIETHDLPEMTRFALQLDRVASKGVDASRVMVDIAKGLAREYRSHVQQSSANMDTQLLLPMTLFFFLPFMVSILVPIMSAFMAAF